VHRPPACHRAEPRAEARALAERAQPIPPTPIASSRNCETPVSAFLKLRELAPGEPAFSCLESADQGPARLVRYSFIGFLPPTLALLRWSLADGGRSITPLAAAEPGPPLFQPGTGCPNAPPFTGRRGRVSFRLRPRRHRRVRSARPSRHGSGCPEYGPDATDPSGDLSNSPQHTVTIPRDAISNAEPERLSGLCGPPCPDRIRGGACAARRPPVTVHTTHLGSRKLCYRIWFSFPSTL